MSAIAREVYIAVGGNAAPPTRPVNVLLCEAFNEKCRDAARALYSKAKCLLYLNGPGMGSFPNQPDRRYWACGVSLEQAQANGWVALDTNGQAVRNAGYGSTIADLRRPGYAAAWAKTAVDLAVQYGWDGVFMDDGTMTARGLCYPWGPAPTTMPLWIASDSLWSAAQLQLVEAASDALHAAGKLLYMNLGPRMDSAAHYAYAALPLIDGALDEVFCGSSNVPPDAGDGTAFLYSWRAGINFHRVTSRSGVDSLCRFKFADTQADFGLGSYLLVAEPNSAAYSIGTDYNAQPTVDAVSKARQLGTPIAGSFHREADGTYTRRFLHGSVRVNPLAGAAGGLAGRSAVIAIT